MLSVDNTLYKIIEFVVIIDKNIMKYEVKKK